MDDDNNLDCTDSVPDEASDSIQPELNPDSTDNVEGDNNLANTDPAPDEADGTIPSEIKESVTDVSDHTEEGAEMEGGKRRRDISSVPTIHANV